MVGLNEHRTNIPAGSERDSLTKSLWIQETATADDVEGKMKETFGWKHGSLRYMYASGRYLRKATLDDIENATSWDVSTVRALMGNGCLYVTRIPEHHETEMCGLSSTSDSDDVEVSVYVCYHVRQYYGYVYDITGCRHQSFKHLVRDISHITTLQHQTSSNGPHLSEAVMY